MTILAIDPGTTQSAAVWVHEEQTDIQGLLRTNIAHVKTDNNSLLCTLRGYTKEDISTVYLEQIQSYGMPVGREVFLTVELCGRIKEICEARDIPVIDVPRRDVKLFWCGSPKAKDSNIRAAILERYGGKEKAVGRKKSPGMFYGIHADEWQALAIALMDHNPSTAVAKESGKGCKEQKRNTTNNS